ncbi:MAG: amidohydrolase [Chloroflexi bacterium]|nr:MAG: amidohydrolase [Chloroflexota bacterium]
MKNADLLITNARILSEENQTFSVVDASIAIQGGRILEIGEQKNLAGIYDARKTWDAKGKLLLPGMVNTHCHLFQTFMRSLGKELTFMDWVHRSVRLFMPLLDDEAIYLAAMMGCLEAIRTGTTTLVDYMYANVKPRNADAVLRAFDDCGIRGVLALGLTDVKQLPGSPVPSTTFSTVEDSLADIERMKLDYAGHPRVSFMLAPSVIWAMTRDGLADAARYAKEKNMVMTMHLLETADDDRFSQEKYGKRTTRMLEDIGVLDANFLAVHAVRLIEEDFDLFERYHTSVSHNPVANMILGSGVAPVCELTRRGIPIGLGTDGAASNDSQNMIEVMKSAVLLQKVHHHDPNVITARQVFRMATSEGAQTIKMDDQVGTLSPGKRADIIVVDLDLPNTTPWYEPVTSLVYSGSERNISAVFIEGQLVLEAGKTTRVNEADLIHRAQQKATELYKIAYAK